MSETLPLTFIADDVRPFRARSLSASGLEEHAAELAGFLAWTTKKPPRDTALRPLVDGAEGELSEYNRLLSEAILGQQPVSLAAEWLLDNHYLIGGQINAIRGDLPPGYGSKLPRVIGPHFTDLPRVWAMAVNLIAHTDARLDEESILAFATGFQRVSPLTIGEVWAIPIMLRIALVENVRRLAREVVQAHIGERAADSRADALLLIEPQRNDELDFQMRLLDAQVDDLPDTFVVRLAQRMAGQEVWAAQVLGQWIGERISKAGLSLDKLSRSLQREQAANQVSIANTISSIRFIEANEWRAFFEQASLVEQILRQDPAGVYRKMDFFSKDRYRHALEQLAKRSRVDEVTAAEATVALCLGAMEESPADFVRTHVGHYLIGAGRFALEGAVAYKPQLREWLYRGPLAKKWLLYLGLVTLQLATLSMLMTAWLLWAGAGWALALAIIALALLPFSELALGTTNRIVAWLFPPRVLPKLDYLQPLSEAHRTLVVVPTLLSSVGSVRRVLDNLEVAYLANKDDNLGFALLGDLKASDEPHRQDDAMIIDAAIRGVETLNSHYQEEHGRRPFAMFLRERRFNPAEKIWMGWERKRGSLEELNSWLRGASETSFSQVIADKNYLRSVTFVITLDADTILPRDAARKLVGTIAHPLNRADWSPGDPIVRGGYGLVQPKVGMALPSSARSFFAWLYAGDTGVDPYAGAVSDTYQDLFFEGSFTGKGIYEVSVFAGVLERRFPENTLLSHDLIEGCHLRVLLASDIELLDDHPASYLGQVARMHRWVRGDWQAARWLFSRVPDSTGGFQHNPLLPLHRWKIFDNLRRSLFAPSLFALMVIGWAFVPKAAFAWPAVISLIAFFPALFRLLDSVFSRRKSAGVRDLVARLWGDFAKDSTRALLTLVFLPHQAQQMCDAIVRALWRMLVSKRKLLEWETAADVEKRISDDLSGYIRRMGPSSALAFLALLPASLLFPERALISLPLGALWAAAPYVAWRISRTSVTVPERLSAAESTEVRKLARRTWRFFETFVTEEGHYLAPDNFQEDPKGEVAWRTSPTNIGLQVLSSLSAYDLGYLTVSELVERSSDTLNTMAGLERHSGHYYNWYDIRTLEPLPPRYVSTVDSGNLAGHLLVFRVGLLETSEAPILIPALLAGLVDTASLAIEDLADAPPEISRDDIGRLREALSEFVRGVSQEEPPAHIGEWHVLLTRLEALFGGVSASISPGSDWQPFLGITHRLDALRQLLNRLAPWGPLLVDAPIDSIDGLRKKALCPLLEYVPSLVGLAEGLDTALATLDSLSRNPSGDSKSERDAVAEWASALAAGIRDTRPVCQESLGKLRVAANMTRQMWEHMDFRLLFDERRLLFAIGYNTAEGRLDPSYYDMLASECRLASFLAIAKGDVPQEHWFRLGRTLAALPGRKQALVSWSASMFEYLMPLLVMRTWPLTLLDETCSAVLDRQIQYGEERAVPWGVSESAFNAKDSQLTYQYQAFGVPGLGLKRGLSSDLVISPYASALAMQVSPKIALSNLKRLSEQGACGHYGYYEALDYTPGRVQAGSRRALVKAYFAHHQGMSLVAFGNALTKNRMQQRFHSDPMVRSAELLLQERVPKGVPLTQPHVEEVEFVRSRREPVTAATRSYPLADTPVPSTHFLSNGRYSVMVTNGGGGYSRWQDLAVTRYREDVTRDCWGQFLYLRDADSGRIWGATRNPCPTPPDKYHVTLTADKAEFRRSDGLLETHLEISVSPEDDIEIRRLTISNHGREARSLQVTSYLEIAFAAQAADQAHKGFSNLFVETEVLPAYRALLFSRRPRSAHEPRRFGLHLLACEATEDCPWSYETDRAAFLGRLNGVTSPKVIVTGRELGGATGAVLDPICSIQQSVSIEPGMSARLVFVTGVAESREDVIRLAEKYHDVRSAQRAVDLAWSTSQIELRDLGLSPEDAVVMLRLASRLLLTDPYSMLKVKTPVENGLPMSGLWSLGISGDLPILLVRVEDLTHTPLVRQALLAHQYWRYKGFTADLVILNTRPTAYSDELDDRLRILMRTGHSLQLVDRPGGIFLRRADQMHPDILNLLLSVARATLEGDAGSIKVQLDRRAIRPVDPDVFIPTAEPKNDPAPVQQRPDLLFDNGYGGFDPATGDYVIVLEDGATTPAPWINVMASPSFGCMVSEAGVTCTWAENSHENRITTWNNDPVSDGSGEAIYIRDEDTGEFWSPTLLPTKSDGVHVIRHGTGSTCFEHTSHGIFSRLDVFVSAEDPVRVARLKLTNTTGRLRKLSVTQFVEWVLGSSRSKAQHQVVTWYDAEHESVTAHNHYNQDYPGRATFLACDKPLHSYTCSRTEFVGRNRHPADPAAMHRRGLGRRTGRHHDNCGAIMTHLTLEPGGHVYVNFLLGQTATLDESRTLIAKYREPGAVDDALVEVRERWNELLKTVQVATPDRALDSLLNGWLLYQATSCRLWGRTATYQSSGAFGFRDQLQDVLSLMIARPDLVRAQMIEASRHQFIEGDVLHWWQPATGRGVRTRITDDRHWLPYVLAEYLAATGDQSVLHVRTAYIEGPQLEEGQEDNYVQPATSERTASIYEHCCAALDSAAGTGPNGLPLMGGGDWNDGMNRVGIAGRGESVWLAWFLSATLTAFAPICETMGEPERATIYRERAAAFVAAVEKNGWDGSWYRRAYFDDGTPLGTRHAEECRIDAIAQAWAIISGAGDPRRADTAMRAVEEKLVRREAGIIALLSPPFDQMTQDPGYIKGYVPGVRENGGQYTHAALWVILAHLMRGDGDEAHSLLELINPINHALTAQAADTYKVEPYALAADVYAAPQHIGRGGWTWYTGSASWFYQVAIGHLLGLKVVSMGGARYLRIDPCIPKSWPGFAMTYRAKGTTYEIAVENPQGVNRGVARVTLDGEQLPDALVPLVFDGQAHEVHVALLGG